MLEIEADGGHEAAGQRLLLLAREGSLQWQRCRLAPLARQHVVEEAGQEGGEILEDGVDPGRGAVGLVLIEQRVVERASRSEEHTSELPSLMRNSYAVFCSKKKKTHT